ncbi:MAG TPA: LpqB family beta-propeller domain-containing protein [Gemmatimonadota bacterium]|nr:LpqB family beta-propeller domain-containing protein [Gemmatimonadota bacterium]
MSGRFGLVPATVSGLAALGLVAGSACLYSPPDQLPSSVRILYSKHDVDSLAGSTDIWFIVARKGNELRLTGDEGEDTQPFFAPGIRRVFFTRRPPAGREEIWSMDLDGNDERRILGSADADYRDPAVAPDDRRIAFTMVRGSRSQVMVAEVDGANARPLADGLAASQPAWSPDGSTLAVVGEEGGRKRILLVPAAGGPPRALTPGGNDTQTEPDWSPDGARLAFTSGEGRDAEIAVATVAGGEATRLTDNDVEDRSPTWSTSGERIAFVSRRPDAKENLWLVDPDGEDLDDLTDYDEDEARDPDWL